MLDLAVQIACREGDEAAARAWLQKLESFDSEAFYMHRLSTIEMRFGDVKSALNAAINATSLEQRPTFGMLVQLVTCHTRNAQLPEAEQTVQRIKKLYGNQKEEIRLGLECRLDIERKQFGRALHVLDNMNHKSLLVYKSMRRDAIKGELATASMTDAKRIAYEQEIENLNSDLGSFDDTDAWLKLV